MKRNKNKSIIPGFGLSLGITITILSFVVLIPLCSLVVYTANLNIEEFVHTVFSARVLASYKISIFSSLIAAIINCIIGVIIAWVLVRYEFPGKRIMDGIIELPFALPTAVAGIALTHLCVSDGWVGKFFGLFGIEVAYTPFGIIIALIFIGIPFVVRSVQPVLEKIDPVYEEAAGIMGASQKQIFRQVILPEICPAMIGGFTLAFARGLGEYGSVVFIAGNTPYKTEITPLLIMSKLQEFNYEEATAIALVMLVLAFLILFVNAVIQSITTKIVSGK